MLALSAYADNKLDRLVKKHKYQKAVQYIEKKYPPETRDVEMWYKLGDMSEGIGMSEKAMGCYLAVISKNSNDVQALMSLVRLYNRMHQYQSAYVMVRKLLQVKGSDPGILWEAAKICINLKKCDEAKGYLLKVYKTNPDAQKVLGDIYYDAKQYREAMPLYKSYFNMKKDIGVAVRIVDYYKNTDSIEDAIEYFQFVADKDKTDTIAKLYLARYLVNKSENASAMKYYNMISEGVYAPVDFYNVGNYKKAEGKLDAAVQFFSVVVDKSPDSASIHKKSDLELGLLYLEQRDYKESIEHLTAVKSDVQDYSLYMAKAYDALRDRKKSEQYAVEYLKKYPNSIQANMIYAAALEERGYITKAKKIRDKVIKFDFYNSNIHYEMASYYFENGQYSSAIKHFEKSYLLDQNIICMERIAFCAYNIDQTDKARDASELVLKIKSDNKTALNVLYKIYFKKGKYNQAVPYLEELTKLEPMNIGLFLKLSMCYEKLGNYDKIISVDERIIEIDPNNVKSKRRLAENRFNKGKFEDALNMYSDLIKAGKIKVTDYPNIVSSALKLNLKTRAVEYLDQYCQLKPNNSDIYKELGRLNFELKRYDVSLSHYLKALSINPNLIGVYKNYAKLTVIKKWGDSSIIFVSEKAIRLKEVDLTVYDNLGDAYVKVGNRKKALVNYQEAMKYDQKNIKVFSKLAKCQIANGMINEAILSYEQLVALDTIKENYKTLGDLYNRRSSKKDAVANYKKYLKYVENEKLFIYVSMYEYKSGNFEEAIKYFDRIKNFSSETMFARADSYLKCKRYKETISILMVYVSKYPSSKSYYLANKMLGVSNDKLGNTLSIKYYQAYLGKIKDKDVAYRVGELQEKVSMKAALATYGANVLDYSKDYRNYVKLGTLIKSNPNKAAYYYEKALEINDTLLSVLLKLGTLYDILGEEDNKISAYKRAVALEPQNFVANKYLGITLFNKNKTKEGLLYLELARSQKSDDPEIMYTLGKSYVQDGKLAEAVLLFQASKKLLPGNCDVRYTLVSTLISEGLYQEALKESEELLKKKEIRQYFDQYILVQFSLKRYMDVEQAVKLRRRQNPEDVSLLMTMAKAQYLDRRYDDALQSYVMISFIKDGYEPAYIGRAETYIQMGKIDNAKMYYEKVLKVNPKSFDANLGLALLYKSSGDKNSYMEYLRKAREIKPNDVTVQKEMETLN
jgi:tetratricopeptide (TPR) repeat protein